MTKSSPSRLQKRLAGLTFGDLAPKHWAMPEDVPLLLRTTARDCAGAFFEENKRSPRFRGRWRDVRQYITLNWPSYLPIARTILVNMLRNPGVSLAQKDEIAACFFQQSETKTMLDMSEHLAPGPVA